MIRVDEFSHYWESMVSRVRSLDRAVGITVDENMGNVIASEDTRGVTLFFLPPSAEGTGGVDNYKDRNVCLVFVMADADVQRGSVMEVLAMTQKTVLEVRDCLLADRAAGCRMMKLEPSTISIMPETSFYRSFVGWSMSFTTT